jgi:hypothetical protein
MTKPYIDIKTHSHARLLYAQTKQTKKYNTQEKTNNKPPKSLGAFKKKETRPDRGISTTNPSTQRRFETPMAI